MTQGKPDRRVQRTRQALARAFVNLVLERGYESLSVADVTERANVGRSTFYAHYGGLDGLLRESLSWPSSELASALEPSTKAQMLAPILSHFHDQRRINRAFFVSPLRGLWVRRLAEMIEPRLGPSALPGALVAQQIAEAQIGLVANWLGQRPGTPPEVVAEALLAMSRALLASLTADS